MAVHVASEVRAFRGRGAPACAATARLCASTVHEREQLCDDARLVAALVTALGAEGVNLVDEDDAHGARRRVRLGCLKHFPQAAL